MEYEVLDVAELIDFFNIQTDRIEECTSVWGDGDELVLCLTTIDNYLWLERRPDGAYIEFQDDESFDKYMPDHFDDYVTSPFDVNSWLADGGELDNAHEY
jgi:hypothetical protein